MKNNIILFYLFFLLLFLLFSYVFVDANLVYLKVLYTGIATRERGFTSVVFIIFISLFFLFYYLFLKSALKKAEANSIKQVVILSILILFLSYPAMLSYDIFNYLTTSKVLYHYHENPYIIMPIEFSGEPYLQFTRAANKIALYGPTWIIMSAIPYLFGFGNFIATLFTFKLISLLFYLFTVFLLWKLSKNFLPIVFFALNPLVLIEIIGEGHNDIVMISFVLLSFLLLQKKKIFFAALFLLLSIGVKYATIFLIPVFIYTVWRIYKKKETEWRKIYFWSFLSMLAIFMLSPLREEIYPWYAIWFLPFIALMPERKILYILSFVFSFSLLLRYVPFMLLGTYFGSTPFNKIFVTFVPIIFTVGYFLIKHLWQKRPCR